MFGRIFANTFKQIRRSGWVAWSSVSVMSLAFFVATIFGGLAYMSNLYIRFFETRDNVIVFFEEGTDQTVINRLREKWDGLTQVKSIQYFTEEEAYNLYLEGTRVTNPIAHKILSEKTVKKLPSSLDIRLNNLDEFPQVKDILINDIETELEGMEYDPKRPPIELRANDERIDEYREVFTFLRVGGAVVLTSLFIIIFFFTLMTVEFRTYNRMEEIGVMQLVGGSLWYIRAPFILEGAVYGMVGALVSTIIVGSVLTAVFVFNPDAPVATFILERIQYLPIPYVSIFGWIALVAAKLGLGFLLGSVSSYLAIRRYIK